MLDSMIFRGREIPSHEAPPFQCGALFPLSAFVTGLQSHTVLTYTTWMPSPDSKPTAARSCVPMSISCRALHQPRDSMSHSVSSHVRSSAARGGKKRKGGNGNDSPLPCLILAANLAAKKDSDETAL